MLILASSSKSRLSILKSLQLEPSIIASPEVDESHLKNETPLNLSKRLASLKAQKIFNEYKTNHTDLTVIAADTVVCVGRKILEKASSKEDIESYLRAMSGRNHTVYTSICIIYDNGKEYKRTSKTKVKFKRLTEAEIYQYSSLNEGLGKAGGYSIAGIAESFIININGSYSGVIGLPTQYIRNFFFNR